MNIKISILSKIRKKSKILLLMVLGLIIFLYCVFPIYSLFLSTTQPSAEVFKKPPNFIPRKITFSRYLPVIKGVIPEAERGTLAYDIPSEVRFFPKSLFNSTVITTCTTIITMMMGILAAYAFVRMKIKNKQYILFGILGVRMIPGVVLIVPIYLAVLKLNMLNSASTLVLVYNSITLPYIIWILISYFETIPLDYEEAAMIDGCTRLQALIKVFLPLAKPGLIAAMIFTIMIAWGEFFFALMLNTDRRAFTIPVVVSMFVQQTHVDVSYANTVGFLSTIPPLIIAFIFQRYIVGGLLLGGSKG